MPPRPTVDAEVERLQTEVERHKTEMARLERELSTAKAELSTAKLDVQRLQDNEQRDAASNEQVLRLQRELDEIRLKAASAKSGGVSSREFLDLREALNKKEKEILGLRDQIHAQGKRPPRCERHRARARAREGRFRRQDWLTRKRGARRQGAR